MENLILARMASGRPIKLTWDTELGGGIAYYVIDGYDRLNFGNNYTAALNEYYARN